MAAARAVFTENGTSAPLEDVAERAGVGIGTLYRHFPTRQALLEAVYVDEVEAMARAADELVGAAAVGCAIAVAAPVRRLRSDQAGAQRGVDGGGSRTRTSYSRCRTAITGAGTALVERAQRAGVIRADTNFMDVVRMVGAIALVPTADPGQKERMLELALDGLRYRPQGS